MSALAMPAQHWLLEDLIGEYAAVPTAARDLRCVGLSADSRTTSPGDLFLARAGGRQHGLNYAGEAVARGAVAVAWEPSAEAKALPTQPRVPYIRVEQLSERLGPIAARFFGNPSRYMTVIGVTGTDGKTSVSQFLAQALQRGGTRCGVVGTLGYGLAGATQPGGHTTPDAVSLQALLAEFHRRDARWVAMEVSSHGLDQGRVNGVAFDTAILTNLTRDHLDYHGDAGRYAHAKKKLFVVPGLKRAIINLDDPFGYELIGTLPATVSILGYSAARTGRGRYDSVVAREVAYLERGITLQVDSPWGGGTVTTNLLGDFNVLNVLAVLSTLVALGVNWSDALARVSDLKTVPGRMEPFGGHAKPLVIVDYAHTPAALEGALRAVRSHCKGRLWCVFGCGGERDRGKRPLMAAAAERHADRVIVTDDNPRNESPERIVSDVLGGFADPAAHEVIHDRCEAIGTAIERAGAGDAVLVAGKGHETAQIIAGESRPYSDRVVVVQALGSAPS